MDDLCGSHSALQSFKSHATRDRSLQQDRLITEEEALVDSFRATSHGINAAADTDVYEFQRGHVLLPDALGSSQFSPQQQSRELAAMRPFTRPTQNDFFADQHVRQATLAQEQTAAAADGWVKEFEQHVTMDDDSHREWQRQQHRHHEWQRQQHSHHEWQWRPQQQTWFADPHHSRDLHDHEIDSAHWHSDFIDDGVNAAADPSLDQTALDEAFERAFAQVAAEQNQREENETPQAVEEREAPASPPPRSAATTLALQEQQEDALAESARSLLHCLGDAMPAKLKQSQFVSLLAQLGNKELVAREENLVNASSNTIANTTGVASLLIEEPETMGM